MSKSNFSNTYRVILSAIFIFIVFFFFNNCSRPGTNSKINVSPPEYDIIEINESTFAAQINEVFRNPANYFGEIFKLEGIIKKEQYIGNEKPYYFVIRYAPGECCDYDTIIGFEVRWDELKEQFYPEDDSWVQATGILKTYEENGYDEYLYLDLSYFWN